MICLGGEIGRHKGLKIPRSWHAGSSPARGTRFKAVMETNDIFLERV